MVSKVKSVRSVQSKVYSITLSKCTVKVNGHFISRLLFLELWAVCLFVGKYQSSLCNSVQSQRTVVFFFFVWVVNCLFACLFVWVSCWPDARITLLYQSVQSYCAVISLSLSELSAVCLLVCVSCWPESIVTLSKCTIILLVVFFFFLWVVGCLFVCLFVKLYSQSVRSFCCRLFVCVSYWQDESIAFQSVESMCQSSSFVCLCVSCWLDTGFTLSKCTANRLLFLGCRLFVCVSYWQEASITFSKCTVNVLVFFFCLFVCELSTGHKHHLYSQLFVKVYSQLLV